jgi:hypothetical protein
MLLDNGCGLFGREQPFFWWRRNSDRTNNSL